jgi:hypothetical protein
MRCSFSTNRNLNLQRYKVLYVSAISTIQIKLDRRFLGPGDPPGFMALQLMTILEEARHTLISIEHDPCFTSTLWR